MYQPAMEELPCLDMEALSLAHEKQEEPKLIVHELLWTKICEQLNPAEFDEVKSTLGSELIDGNEVGTTLRALPSWLVQSRLWW